MTLREKGREETDIDMPHAIADVVRSWPGTNLICISSDFFIPCLGLQVPNSSGEETGCNEIEKTGRSDEEILELGRSTSSIPSQNTSFSLTLQISTYL